MATCEGAGDGGSERITATKRSVASDSIAPADGGVRARCGWLTEVKEGPTAHLSYDVGGVFLGVCTFLDQVVKQSAARRKL